MNRIIKTTAVVLSSGLIATGVTDSISLSTGTSGTVSAATQGKKKSNPIKLDAGVYDDLSAKKFAKKYKGKFIEFDGLLTSIRKYDHYKNKANMSLVIGDDKGAMFTDAVSPIYMIAKSTDVPAATQGWIKKTKTVNDDLREDPDTVHVTAKVQGYKTVKDAKGSPDMKGHAVYLKPVKVKDNAAIYQR